ncbi:SMI1/KNR4 family protein [Butyrivibrio sp. JL13D10]|uniref:SMI1/KNR4 family protein n=1 Tax=Butyrivibrio sp. JL13D10 TaxID=3236815 RepID=UPI0038B5ED68
MNKNLLEKINAIFDMEDMKKNVLSESKLQQFEDELCIKLPKDYREYILKYPSLYVKDDYKVKMKECSMYTPDDGFDYVEYLYGSELVSTGKGRMKFIEEEDESDCFLPIGESAGDMILICVKGKEYGKVFMYYHESDEKNVPAFLIADSFEEFINGFELRPDDDIDYSKVKIRLDDDLLKSIEEFKNRKKNNK